MVIGTGAAAIACLRRRDNPPDYGAELASTGVADLSHKWLPCKSMPANRCEGT